MSPDGTRFAFSVVDERVEIKAPKGEMTTNRWKVLLRDVAGSSKLTEAPRQDEMFTGRAVWSRDGRWLFCSLGGSVGEYTQEFLAGRIPDERRGYLVVDVESGKAARSPIPFRHTLIGDRADGSLVIVGYARENRKVGNGTRHIDHERLFVLSADGREQSPVDVKTPDGTWFVSLSPGGDRVLSMAWNPQRTRKDLSVVDIPTAKCTPLVIPGLPADEHHIWHMAWSPDGKRIALAYILVKNQAPLATCVGVADADGKNFREVRREKAEKYQSVAWR